MAIRKRRSQVVANATEIKALYEAQRDRLIAAYEAGEAVDVDQLNFLHDTLDALDRAARYADTTQGDWNDRTARWHY